MPSPALRHGELAARARECPDHHQRHPGARCHRQGAAGRRRLIACQFPTYLGALDSWRTRMPAYRKLRLDSNDCDPLALAHRRAVRLHGAELLQSHRQAGRHGHARGAGRRGASHRHLAARGRSLWRASLRQRGAAASDRALGAEKPGRAYDGPVLHVRTLSKEVAPGLRIGWVIAAPALIEALTPRQAGLGHVHQRRHATDRAGSAQGRVDRAPAAGDRRALSRAARCALCGPGGACGRMSNGRFPSAACSSGPSRAIRPRYRQAPQAPRSRPGVCITPSSVFDPSGRNRRAIRINFTLNPPDRLRRGRAAAGDGAAGALTARNRRSSAQPASAGIRRPAARSRRLDGRASRSHGITDARGEAPATGRRNAT